MDLNILVKEEGEDSWNQPLEYFFMLMLPWNLAFSSSQFWSGMWGGGERKRNFESMCSIWHKPFCWCSVTQCCLSLWDHMDCSTPGFPVHKKLQDLAQIHVHRVNNVIYPSHPLLSHSPLALIFPSIRVFSNESGLHIGGQGIGASASASVLPMIFRTDFL